MGCRGWEYTKLEQKWHTASIPGEPYRLWLRLLIKKIKWVPEAQRARVLLILMLEDVFTGFAVHHSWNIAINKDLRLTFFVNGFDVKSKVLENNLKHTLIAYWGFQGPCRSGNRKGQWQPSYWWLMWPKRRWWIPCSRFWWVGNLRSQGGDDQSFSINKSSDFDPLRTSL